MPDGFVTIATYSTPLEADLSRLKLESEDIPVCILDSHLGSMNPIYGVAAGVRLQVPKEFAELSLDVLKTAPEPELFGEELFGDDEEDEDSKEHSEYLSECPKCASQNIGRYNYAFSIIGFILQFVFGYPYGDPPHDKSLQSVMLLSGFTGGKMAKKRKTRSHKWWAAELKKKEESGLSLAEYARQHGINAGTMYRWQSLLAEINRTNPLSKKML